MSAPVDLAMHLDARQVGMLKAMGVTVWQAPTPTPSVTEPEPVRNPVSAAEVQRTAPTQSSLRSPNPTTKQRPQETAASSPIRADLASLDWAALQQAVNHCQACPLSTHRKHTVFGTGSPSGDAQQAPRVDWLIVGEAPGEQEDQAAEPFVGPAGKLLDNMLSALGLSRKSAQGGGVYILNTIKCRPPANRNPGPGELLQCSPFLHRQIELLQPRVILAMGRYAAQSLLQHQMPDVEKMPLGKLRGQAHAYKQIPVVVTYHPAYLLRNLPEKSKAWEDLVFAQQLLQHLKSAP
jgi:uracil-DNA glycosylase